MAATRRFVKVQHGKICCLLSVSMLCKRKQCWTLSALRSVLGRLYWNTVQNGGQWLHTWTTRCPFSVSQLSSEDVQCLRSTVNKVQPNVAHHTRWDRLISLSFVCTSLGESIITQTLIFSIASNRRSRHVRRVTWALTDRYIFTAIIYRKITTWYPVGFRWLIWRWHSKWIPCIYVVKVQQGLTFFYCINLNINYS